MISLLLNLVIAVSTAICIGLSAKESPMHVVMRFFTSLSNVFCGIAGAVLVVFRALELAGTIEAIPNAILVIKYSATASVTVTLLTVMVFLGPVVIGYKPLLTGTGLWLHLINPVLALVSLFIWDKPTAGFWVVFLGLLPVVLYGILYLYKVVVLPQGKGWDDFYGFNRSGKWPLSFTAMMIGGFLVSLALWLIV